MLRTTALPARVGQFYHMIGQRDAARAAECVRKLTFNSKVAGALLPAAQALHDCREFEGLELLSTLITLETGNKPRDLFANQVGRLNKIELKRIRTIIEGKGKNDKLAARFLVHSNLLAKIRLAFQNEKKGGQNPRVNTPRTIEASEALQFFYSALWIGNGPMAAAFLDDVDFSPETIEMLFPVAQGYYRVNGWKALSLISGLFTLRGTKEVRLSLAHAIGEATRRDLRSTAQIIDRVGRNPRTQALFRTRPAYLAAVRRALMSGKASNISKGGSGDGERFTDKDWEFMLAMKINEGAWTRDSLLALTTHVSSIKWSAKNNLQKFYRTLADLCRQNREHILKQQNGVSKKNLVKIEADLEKLGLSFGMPIGKPSAWAMAHYALHRADLVSGDEVLLSINVTKILQGMPLSAADVDEVNNIFAKIPATGWRHSRRIATLSALVEALPEVTSKLDKKIIQRIAQTLSLIGFNKLAVQVMDGGPANEADGQDVNIRVIKIVKHVENRIIDERNDFFEILE